MVGGAFVKFTYVKVDYIFVKLNDVRVGLFLLSYNS